MEFTVQHPLSCTLFQELQTNSDTDRARAMEAYMKHQFAFFGVAAPVRKVVTSGIKKSDLIDLKQTFPPWIKECWLAPQREMQYAVLDLLIARSKWLTPQHLPMLEWMMVTKSWWDTVDGIAPGLAGSVFLRFPESRDQWIETWLTSKNLWLNRASLIFQLKYGRKTDWDFLQQTILTHIESREFFIRKAQGWALRQYAKLEPREVKMFVESHPELSGLTKREALKHL